jgi:hypothetical protein
MKLRGLWLIPVMAAAVWAGSPDTVASGQVTSGQATVTTSGGRSGGSGAGAPQGPLVTTSGPPPTQTVLPPGTGAIGGTVTDAASGQPLAGAVVSLSVASRATIGRTVREITDERGRFVFTKLSARDDYQLTASLSGYFDTSFGQTSLRPTQGRVTLSDGQWFPNANIAMSKGGSISGTVLDEHGEPVVGVYVHVLAQVLVSGVKQLASGPTTTTDDRGAYRLANLGPGDYLVAVPSVSATVPASANASTASTMQTAALDTDNVARLAFGKYPIPPPAADGRRYVYPAYYAPDAPSPARATPVTLALGDTKSNVDVRIAPVTGSAIRGRVESGGDALPSLTLRLLPASYESIGTGGEAGTAMVGTDGSFTFLNVPAGTYTIDVRRAATELAYNGGGGGGNVQRLPLPPGTTSYSINSSTAESAPVGVSISTTSTGAQSDLWGRAPVTVAGQDINDVVLTLRHGGKIAGHAIVEPKDPSKPPVTFPLFVRAEPADGNPATGVAQMTQGLESPMDFEVAGLAPGRYVLRFTRQAPSTVVKKITLNGEDFTTRPIDLGDGRDVSGLQVTFTELSPTLNGTIRTGANGSDAKDVKDSSVIAFPVDPEQWANYGFSPIRIRTTSTTAQGGFHFNNLPEGDYFVVAVPTSDIDAWQNPETLKQLARSAARVSLKWGQASTVEVTVVKAR